MTIIIIIIIILIIWVMTDSKVSKVMKDVWTSIMCQVWEILGGKGEAIWGSHRSVSTLVI